jgi:TRAP transporter TAXI family solute receptor
MKRRFLMNMFGRSLTALIAAGIVGIGFSTAPQAETYVAIGTAKATGSWYPLGAALSTVVSKHASNVTAKVESTKGGMANVHLLAKKQVDVAFVPPWAIADAIKGAGDYTGKKGFPAKVSGWFGFAPNYLTIMVPAGSGIKSVADLRGKSVNMGAPGTFNRPILQMVLKEHGIKVSEIKPLDIALGPSVNRLKNRQLDAVWWWSATPASAFTDAAVSIDTKLVGLTPSMIDKLTGKYSWFSKGSVAPGVYKGTASATPTVFTKISAAMLSSVPEDVAYKMTKAVFEHLDELSAIHPVFKKLSKENALEGLSIPLHPGVEKYYREIGVPGLDAFAKKVAQR